MSLENWDSLIKESVFKSLKKFPKKDSKYIMDAMEELSMNLYSGDIKRIKGESNVWRKRVGNYRIFYEIHKTIRTIVVFKVERRSSHTY